MPPVGFEPNISAGERPQTYALNRAPTGTGSPKPYFLIISMLEKMYLPWDEIYHFNILKRTLEGQRYFPTEGTKIFTSLYISVSYINTTLILVPKVGLERLPVTKICPHALGKDSRDSGKWHNIDQYDCYIKRKIPQLRYATSWQVLLVQFARHTKFCSPNVYTEQKKGSHASP